jgi:hypothetical protein
MTVSTIVTPAGAATALGLSARGPVITNVAGRRTLLAPVVAVVAGGFASAAVVFVAACAGPGEVGVLADEPLAPAIVEAGAGAGEERLGAFA